MNRLDTYTIREAVKIVKQLRKEVPPQGDWSRGFKRACGEVIAELNAALVKDKEERDRSEREMLARALSH